MTDWLLFGIAGLLALGWYVGRSPKVATGDKVRALVFCMHCNWQGRVGGAQPRCGACGSRHLSVLSV